jgi:hypothetical protein
LFGRSEEKADASSSAQTKKTAEEEQGSAKLKKFKTLFGSRVEDEQVKVSSSDVYRK